MTNEMEGKRRRSGIFKMAAIAGILMLIVTISLPFLGIIPMDGPEELISLYTFLTVTGILHVVFIYGFKVMGEEYHNNLLKVASYPLIVAVMVVYGSLFWTKVIPLGDPLVTLSILCLILFGGAMIPFGIGLLRLKMELGSLATGAGVLGIILGVSALTGILAFIAVLLSPPLYILLVILLFRAAKKLETTPAV